MPRRSCRRQATADMTGSDTMGGGMYGSDRDGVRAAFADGAVSFWEALDALVKYGVINTRDYWAANMGKLQYISDLICKAANALPEIIQ